MRFRVPGIGCSAIWAAVFCIAAQTPTTAAVLQVAAVEGGTVGGASHDPDIPWSEQVLEIQRALLDLGVYDGPLDGKLNAATEKAIRQFGARYGRIGAGGITPDGILNLTAVTDAVRIQRLLEKSRQDQVKRARTALLQNEKTRDLVSEGRWSKGSADIGFDRECTPESMTECSIAQALDEIAKINREDYRDWVLRDVVRVLGGLGRERSARDVIAKISDPRLILVALRELAVGLGSAGDLRAAADIARTIPDLRNRAKALGTIALLYLKAGERETGKAMLADMLAVLGEEANTSNYVSQITNVVQRLHSEGHAPEAHTLMPYVEARMAGVKDPQGLDAEWSMIAAAYMALGDERPAKAALERIKSAETRATLILPTSKMLRESATESSDNTVPRSQAQRRALVMAINNLARAREAAGDRYAARQLLTRSSGLLPQLDGKYASDFVRAGFVDLALQLDMPEKAYDAAQGINRKTLKTKKLWSFVGEGLKDVPVARAKAETDAISNHFERCLIYLHASHVVADKMPESEVKQLIDEARRLAETLEQPWWRARALVSLAAAYRQRVTPARN